jgi:hypothetical protein
MHAQLTSYYGKIASELGRRPDEMIAISGAHTLLTNLVDAYCGRARYALSIVGWIGRLLPPRNPIGSLCGKRPIAGS